VTYQDCLPYPTIDSHPSRGGGTVSASPPPTGTGDPSLCGSLVTPFPYVDLETRGFAVFVFSSVYFS